jgi:Leucine-rich repeat (LRR) protein
VDWVDLSFNEFVAMPTSALTEVSATLRSLDLSHNALEHLDSTMFANTPRLLSLSLANNRLTILPNNIFIGLNSLRTLDLSANPIRANYPDVMIFVQRLSTLKLADVEMTSLPIVPLRHLNHLDLSGNRLMDVPFLSAESLPNLRLLNLSRNQVRLNNQHRNNLSKNHAT